MTDITIKTNNVPRPVLNAWELTPKEREEFDYLDWDALERGEDSASFVRYRGEMYDLGDFMRWDGVPSSPLRAWDGYRSDSFFSGVLVRWAREDSGSVFGESVVMGTYFS